MATTSSSAPSQWQQKITGEWYGLPSIFDKEGRHIGFNKVSRASVFENGKTTYWMHTRLEGTAALRAELEFTDFEFGVIDSDKDRIYLGPDFMGAGHPYGSLVDANYYSAAWRSDLRTMVHILPDGLTQVYSSLLYHGPTLATVFNGIYLMASDYESNPQTRARIDAHIEAERVAGLMPHMLPPKHQGRWVGEMQVWSRDQEFIGTNQVTMHYRPIDLLRAEQTIEISGVINRRYQFERTRTGDLHTFDGPDLIGNGMGYGRALWTRQHFYGEALKISGREFLIDSDYTMSVVWQFIRSDVPEMMSFGLLKWEQGDEVIRKRGV